MTALIRNDGDFDGPGSGNGVSFDTFEDLDVVEGYVSGEGSCSVGFIDETVIFEGGSVGDG
jgi:hypothetical protein